MWQFFVIIVLQCRRRSVAGAERLISVIDLCLILPQHDKSVKQIVNTKFA